PRRRPAPWFLWPNRTGPARNARPRPSAWNRPPNSKSARCVRTVAATDHRATQRLESAQESTWVREVGKPPSPKAGPLIARGFHPRNQSGGGLQFRAMLRHLIPAPGPLSRQDSGDRTITPDPIVL